MNQRNTSGDQTVVITGAGLVTCLGLDRWTTWRGVCESRNGLGPLTELEQPTEPDKGGGQAPSLPADFAPALPREARYLRHVINDAIRESGIDPSQSYPPHRCGLVMGTTLHGMPAAGRFLRSGNAAELGAFLAPAILRLATEGLGFSGFAASTCSACSSGLGSVAIALTLLQSGELDLVIVGGYDVISEYTYAGFNSLRLVAQGPPRPFSPERRGLNLGEGYAAVVLERAHDARRRGAKIIAKVLSAGESADAHHLTQPHPSGDGALRAMGSALERAGLSTADIDLISAHATATPDNDGAEYIALHSAFGEKLAQTPCVAFKSHLGHTLGAAGAVEMILTCMAINDGVIPPTRGSSKHATGFEELLLEATPRPAAIRATLNLSLGFGGANTCVILGRPNDDATPRITLAARSTREVLITGVGVVVPGAGGNAAFASLMSRQSSNITPPQTGEVDDEILVSLIESRRVRRMSQYVKLTLAAATLAVRDASVNGDSKWTEAMSAVLGTAHGSVDFSAAFYRQVVEEGIEAANPMLFAEGVPNGGAAHLGLMLGIKGSCQTILGSRTSGLDALQLAWLRIRSGAWDRAIVCAADESTELVNAAYAHCGLCDNKQAGGLAFGSPSGFVCGAGGAAIVLESADSAARRGIQPRGRVMSCASAVFAPGQADAAVASGTRVLEEIGSPLHVVASANGTWVDRIESAVLGGGVDGSPRTVSSLYGHIAESFSAAPLAAIALLVLTGRAPELPGRVSGPGESGLGGWKPASGSEGAESFGVLCSDYNGLWAGARVGVDPARLGAF